MVSRRHLFYFIASMLVLSLLLVACERPIPGGGGEATATPDEGAGGGVQTPVVETPVVGEPTVEPPTVEVPPTEAPPTEAPPTEAPPTETPTPETTTGDAGGGQTVTTIPETHTVAAGENLYRIGLKYGLSWRDIARFNGINPHRIYVGQVLRLPRGDTGGLPTTGTTYVVRRGDNLFRIGLRYGISWVQIAEANGLSNPNQIYVGQTLKIPANAPGPNPGFSHTVRPGQNLFRISMQYGVPWLSIAQANNIAPPYTIYVGQTLVIPGS